MQFISFYTVLFYRIVNHTESYRSYPTAVHLKDGINMSFVFCFVLCIFYYYYYSVDGDMCNMIKVK